MKTLTTLCFSIMLLNNILSQTTIQYVVIPYDTARKQGMFNKWEYTPARLSSTDIFKIEKMIPMMAENFSRELRNSSLNGRLSANSIFDPMLSCYVDYTNYNQQFVPMLNRKGEKVIFVNCFVVDSYPNVNWQSHIVKKVTAFPADEHKAMFSGFINLNENYCKYVDSYSAFNYTEAQAY